MKISASMFEGIVVPPEAAEKLQEAGFPEEACLFAWTRGRPHELRLRAGSYLIAIDDPSPGRRRIVKFRRRWHAWAPTDTHVLRRLPHRIRRPGERGSKADFLHVMPTVNGTWRVYYKNRSRAKEYSFESATLGEAATAMYCFLHSKRLLP